MESTESSTVVRPGDGSAHVDSPDESMKVASDANVARVGNISLRVDANALSISAMMIAVASLVAVVALTIFQPQITDAKIAAGGADARAVANQARTDARVALDKVEDVRTSLKAAHIKIEEGH